MVRFFQHIPNIILLCTTILVVGVFNEQSSAAGLNLNVTIIPTLCNDGIDNDSDTLTDYPDDTNCTSIEDNSEAPQQCDDGIDNDGDSAIDYPNDPGCSSTEDNDETDPAPSSSSTSSSSSASSSSTSGGGGGGGGGGGAGVPLPNGATFRGKAYPLSTITLLKGGQLSATTVSGPDAKFEISLTGLSAGTYTFGVFGVDTAGRRSITQSFTVSVTAGVTTLVSGIFIPPTIGLDKSEVRRGDVVNILGQTVPNSNVAVVVNSAHEVNKNTISDANGSWFLAFDTSQIEYGDHTTKSRSTHDGAITTFSKILGFKVGTKNVLITGGGGAFGSVADINGDGRVNLIDFSIMLFWYKKPNPLPEADFNSDGKVGLADFSIMMFYWTG